VAGVQGERANDDPVVDPASSVTARDSVHHVLLAADLDGSSTHAVDEAIALAADLEAVLLILTVVPLDPVPAPLRRRRPSVERERRDRAVRDIVARARDRGVVATSVVWYGEPADAILEAARTQRVDIVVLGSRRRTDPRRLFGSVSSRVAERARCPVLIVRA
jgi:nucleotide-binding universal stress UspA family protein